MSQRRSSRFALALLVVSLALAALAGCIGPWARTRSGAAPWRELTSEHFVIWTDTSPRRAHALVQTMEHLRQVVMGVSSFKEVRGKAFVIAFDDLDEVHEFVAEQFIAKTWSAHNPLRQPVIVLAASSLDDDRQVVTHELAHAIAFNVIVNEPAWFSEGLASYFETIRLDEGKATVDVGMPMGNRVRELLARGMTPIPDLFACAGESCRDGRFYATAWAVFTYLLDEHPEELGAYIQRLIQTPQAEQSQLWNDAFPDLPPDKLEHEVGHWIHYGRSTILKYNVALVDAPATERPLAAADALTAKGTLRFLTTRRAGSPPEIGKALALDPTNVLANLIDAAARSASSPGATLAPDLADRIAAAHPDDWRAWWLVGRAAHAANDRPKAAAAREKLCALFEVNPTAVPVEGCARAAGDGGAR